MERKGVGGGSENRSLVAVWGFCLFSWKRGGGEGGGGGVAQHISCIQGVGEDAKNNLFYRTAFNISTRTRACVRRRQCQQIGVNHIYGRQDERLRPGNDTNVHFVIYLWCECGT